MPSFLTNVNLNKNQITNVVVHLLGTDPAGGALTEGLFWYNTVSHQLKYYDGTSVQVLANGAGLTQEQVEDYVGGMVSSNSESGITVTYDDPGGKLDFAVTDSPLLGGQNSAYHLSRANHTGTQAPATITFASTDRLLGRDTAGSGTGEEITVGGGVEFTGSTGIQRSALTGDVTASAGSNTTAIAAGVIVDADVNASAGIAATKLSVTATDRLLGRDTAAAGAVEEITVGGGLEWTGSGGIQRSALTGNVTASAGSNSTTIANGVVTLAMHANMATDRILGRDTAGSGAPEELTVSGGLEFTGTGIQRSALTGDITATAGSNTTAIAAGVIVDADVNASAAIAVTKTGFSTTDRLLGRDTAGSGAGEEISLNSTLEFTGSSSIQRAALTGDITASAGSNTTAIAAGVIVDADVNASAAIAATKLAFTPADTIAATTVQAAIVEALTDARAYADSVLEGQIWKDPVDAATTTALPNSPTYNSGAGTLTAGSNVAFGTIDGVGSPAVGMDYLVKDQASTFQNGIYRLTAVGSGAAPWVLTRRSDANVFGELNDAAVMVEAGTTNIGRVYTQTNTLTNLTSDVQAWTLTNQNQVYTADGSTITLTGNQFAVPSGGITGTQLNASVAGNGLTGGGGSALAVNTGTSSATLLEISSDTVRVSTDAAGNGLTGGGGSPLAVGAGNGITVNANDIAIASTAGGAGLTYTTGVLAVGAGNGITVNADDVALASSTAGAGLTYTTGVLAVGAGNGITVNADDVALASSTAGAGLTYTTGVLAVGAGTGITVNADDVAINTSVVVRKFSQDIGDGSTTAIVVTHSAGTRDITYTVYATSGSFEQVFPDIEHTSTTTMTIRFAVAPTTNQYRVVVHW